MSRHALSLIAAALLAACASTETIGPPAKEMIYAVTASNKLIQFNAGQPQKILSSKALSGLAAEERLLGIDYRVAKGQLFALGDSGQLYRINTADGSASRIGTPVALPREGATEWGFDFNPTVDRIRVVNDAGFNLRLHPDTGAVVDGNADQPGLQFDGRLAYDAADANAGKAAALVAAGYTYNKDNEKITTNYALDGKLGTLVHQGTKEGVTPMVSPNSGRLYTVGSLGLGTFERATLDISDVSNAAYSAVTRGKLSSWYRVDLASGRATLIGTVAGGEAVVGAAIEP
ncbi:DUF4394 domain-containing protein [Paucibacter sp. O1-1]|uniref:DUF4394 domain-containing protein n=1 Tax=Paucibacter sp. XJ19-41 TaxID=2927824 RepID=UPI0010F6574C|nr:DUF4394 domain-containing protein [Paucibacter sp. XJ19-41]MCU7372106.1 DUF4394 domain-containing protein [Paucibacter sp. O1-1]MDA3827096.1 DUF4394 domain-containing protein [Paucibacter sp. O1-1]MDC6170431.1 DUF4394 domain-containing protein [Paucibacter sp. XJ19-41]